MDPGHTLSGSKAAKLFRHACNSICSNRAWVYSEDVTWPEQRWLMASLAVQLVSSVWRLDGAPEHQYSMQKTPLSCFMTNALAVTAYMFH